MMLTTDSHRWAPHQRAGREARQHHSGRHFVHIHFLLRPPVETETKENFTELLPISLRERPYNSLTNKSKLLHFFLFKTDNNKHTTGTLPFTGSSRAQHVFVFFAARPSVFRGKADVEVSMLLR